MNPCGKRTRHGARIGCCATCHELFSGDTAFEKHRRGGTCVAPTEVGLIGRPSKSYPDETVWGLPSGDNPWTKENR